MLHAFLKNHAVKKTQKNTFIFHLLESLKNNLIHTNKASEWLPGLEMIHCLGHCLESVNFVDDGSAVYLNHSDSYTGVKLCQTSEKDT